MSKKKSNEKGKWGGFRKGSGRKARRGGTKKICVSVNRKNWQLALSKWKKRASWLVDLLVSNYIRNQRVAA